MSNAREKIQSEGSERSFSHVLFMGMLSNRFHPGVWVFLPGDIVVGRAAVYASSSEANRVVVQTTDAAKRPPWESPML